MREDSYFRLIDSTSISCIDLERSFSWIPASYGELYAYVFARIRTSVRTRSREKHAYVLASDSYDTSRKIS